MADELNNGQQVQSTEGHESEAINVAGLKAALQKFKTDKVDPLQWPMVAVAELPTATASTMHKIYLVPSTNPKQKNAKDEFITIDNGSEAQTRYTWEQIGSTTVDLSNYATLQALADAIAAVRAEDVAVTTLNAAPTSSTTSYTKGGQSVDFKIGDEVRVADAEQATEGANGYVYYKLYDLVDNQGTKTAYWAEISTLPANVSYIGPTVGSGATSAGFNPETDTVHVTTQSLSAAQKLQARTNIEAVSSAEGVVSSTIRSIVTISQSDYDNLSNKVSTTLYIIV